LPKKNASKTVLILFLISITSFTLEIQLTRAEHVIGVKVGDWVKYDYAPSGTAIPRWMKVEFLAVEGTNITLRLTMHLFDETEDSEALTLKFTGNNLYLGYLPRRTLDTLFGWCFIIATNAEVGQLQVFVELIPTYYIMSLYKNLTGETTRTYAGASRTVVYIDFLGYVGGRYGVAPLNYYWDKQTGVLVEASATIDGVHVTAKATETNLWKAAPEGEIPFWMQWWFWTTVMAGSVVLVGAIYFLRKKKPPTPAAPTLPTEDTQQNTAQNPY